MMTKRIAAIAQLCSTSNKFQNLCNIAQCAGYAKRKGASILLLPECLGFIGSSAQETLQNAERIPLSWSDTNGGEKWYNSLEEIVEHESDESMDKNRRNEVSTFQNDNVSIIQGLSVIARKSGMYISGGGIHELGAPPLQTLGEDGKPSEKERVYNTHLILNGKGEIVAKYRKIHLFDVSIPSQGINLCESNTTAPGTKLVVCDSPIGKLGLSTCYDVRFPEMYSELSNKGGAEILLVPSAFTVPTGKAHWHTLLRGK